MQRCVGYVMGIKERGEAGKDDLRAEWRRVVSEKNFVAAKCGLENLIYRALSGHD